MAVGLVILHVVASLFAYPNYLVYFNQIAGGPSRGGEHLADSNLDWNQNMIRFAKYAKENNITKVYQLCWNGNYFRYYGIENEYLPSEPVKGVVVICAQQLKVTPEGFKTSWVTEREPDLTIGNAMLVWRYDQ